MRRRTLLAFSAAWPMAAYAQTVATPIDPPALKYLRGLYEPYKQADFKGQPYWEADRFFVPDLADAIKRDQATAKQRNEPPLLNGDPFVDAQDWSISSIGYGISTAGDGNWAAIVTFRNQGRPRQLAVFFVDTPQGWRIDDIVGRGQSLRTLLKLR